jgi:hypothetical protein
MFSRSKFVRHVTVPTATYFVSLSVMTIDQVASTAGAETPTTRATTIDRQVRINSMMDPTATASIAISAKYPSVP